MIYGPRPLVVTALVKLMNLFLAGSFSFWFTETEIKKHVVADLEPSSLIG